MGKQAIKTTSQKLSQVKKISKKTIKKEKAVLQHKSETEQLAELLSQGLQRGKQLKFKKVSLI
jgi:hypothetical protein